MKLETRTVQILRNFSSINPSLVFKKGKVVSTVSPGKTIMALARTETDFPQEFAIYELSEFLGALSLYTEPDLEFGDRAVTIKAGRSRVNYIYGNPDNIIKPPAIEKFKMPEVVYEFDLPGDVLSKALKALGTFQLPEIAIVCKDGEVQIQAINSKNPSGNAYSETLGESENEFKAVFRAENLKMLPDNYRVTIARGLAKFVSKDLEYYIAVEAESEFK